MPVAAPTAVDAFRRRGYAVFPRVLRPRLVGRLARQSEALYRDAPPALKEPFPNHGSMIPVPYWQPAWTGLILHRAARGIMRALAFCDPRWVSGYILRKPAQGLPLWWHQDWWAWDDPVSAAPAAPYVFFMYYLGDTTPENGCLRVIPGSHRTRLDLHELLPPAHSLEIKRCALESAAHARRPDEVAVPVRAGDVVVGDARLLHATFANRSAHPRTCVTLWYAPSFRTLPPALRAKLASQHAAASPGEPIDEQDVRRARRRLAGFLPAHTGACVAPAPYSPTPGVHLRG